MNFIELENENERIVYINHMMICALNPSTSQNGKRMFI